MFHQLWEKRGEITTQDTFNNTFRAKFPDCCYNPRPQANQSAKWGRTKGHRNLILKSSLTHRGNNLTTNTKICRENECPHKERNLLAVWILSGETSERGFGVRDVFSCGSDTDHWMWKVGIFWSESRPKEKQNSKPNTSEKASTWIINLTY